MSKPDNAIQNIKEKRKEERERLCKECERKKDEVKGNPKVLEVIEKLEKRVKILEERMD